MAPPAKQDGSKAPKDDVPVLRREGEARRQAGIEVHEWSAADVSGHFSFKRPLALHSPRAAEVDAYRLAHGMLAQVLRRGGEVYDRTRVTAVDVDSNGVILRTDRQFEVRAKRVVVAMGYES